MVNEDTTVQLVSSVNRASKLKLLYFCHWRSLAQSYVCFKHPSFCYPVIFSDK